MHGRGPETKHSTRYLVPAVHGMVKKKATLKSPTEESHNRCTIPPGLQRKGDGCLEQVMMYNVQQTVYIRIFFQIQIFADDTKDQLKVKLQT